MQSLIIILILAILIRAWPLFLNFFRTSDTWFHLWRSSEIESNRYRIPVRNDQFILGGRTCYPPLLHYLMLIFPHNRRERWSIIISPLFDLGIIIIFIVLYKHKLWIDSNNSFCYVCTCYFLSPILLQFRATSIYSVKARTMGRFFLISTLVFFYLFHVCGSYLFFIASAVSFSFLLLSSKFALQAFTFIALCLFFWYKSLLLLILCGFVISIIISKGFCLRSLREHINHQKMYFKKMKYYGSASSINNIKDLKFLGNVFNFFKSPLNYLDILLNRITYTRIVFLMPLFFIFLIFLSFGNVSINFTNTNLTFLLLWLFGCVFAFVITSFKYFISLGQPDRYLEYAIFPVMLIILQSNLLNYFGNVYSLIPFFLFFYFISNSKNLYFALRKEGKGGKNDQYTKLNEFLLDTEECRIVFVPMKLALYFAQNHKHKYFWASPFIEPYVKPEFWDETFKKGRFNFPNSLVNLKEKYNLDTIVMDKDYYKEYKSDLDNLNAKVAYNLKDYSVYKM